MAAARPCPACGETASDDVGAVNGIALRSCSRCESVFTALLLGEDSRQDYGHYYHAENLQAPPVVHRRVEAIVASMAPYRRTNRWLDVGFGAGVLLGAASRQGWHVSGTEVAEGALRAASAGGFDIYSGSVEEIGLPAAAFDVVTAIEVLEHVSDPGALLTEAARLLRHGGMLYLTTPHARGLSARCLRTRWSVVSPPEHLQLFSKSGLRALCTHAGLRERSMRTHALNPYELAQALPWRRDAPRFDGPARVATGYRLNSALSAHRVGMLLKASANRLLDATGLGDTLEMELHPREPRSAAVTAAAAH